MSSPQRAPIAQGLWHATARSTCWPGFSRRGSIRTTQLRWPTRARPSPPKQRWPRSLLAKAATRSAASCAIPFARWWAGASATSCASSSPASWGSDRNVCAAIHVSRTNIPKNALAVADRPARCYSCLLAPTAAEAPPLWWRAGSPRRPAMRSLLAIPTGSGAMPRSVACRVQARAGRNGEDFFRARRSLLVPSHRRGIERNASVTSCMSQWSAALWSWRRPRGPGQRHPPEAPPCAGKNFPPTG